MKHDPRTVGMMIVSGVVAVLLGVGVGARNLATAGVVGLAAMLYGSWVWPLELIAGVIACTTVWPDYLGVSLQGYGITLGGGLVISVTLGVAWPALRRYGLRHGRTLWAVVALATMWFVGTWLGAQGAIQTRTSVAMRESLVPCLCLVVGCALGGLRVSFESVLKDLTMGAVFAALGGSSSLSRDTTQC